MEAAVPGVFATPRGRPIDIPAVDGASPAEEADAEDLEGGGGREECGAGEDLVLHPVPDVGGEASLGGASSAAVEGPVLAVAGEVGDLGVAGRRREHRVLYQDDVHLIIEGKLSEVVEVAPEALSIDLDDSEAVRRRRPPMRDAGPGSSMSSGSGVWVNVA